MALADRDIDTVDYLLDGAAVMLGAGYAFSQVELKEVFKGIRKEAYNLLAKDLKALRNKSKFWPIIREYWPIYVEKVKIGLFHWCNIWTSLGA